MSAAIFRILGISISLLQLSTPSSHGSSSEGVVFESEAFAITHEAVRQDSFEAVALSTDEIISNYRPGVDDSSWREVIFKFSINGLDNERPPFQDHRIFLPFNSGEFETPIYKFGETHPQDGVGANEFSSKSSKYDTCRVTFKVDLRHVLSEFGHRGWFETYDGTRLEATDFRDVFIAGGTHPLTWNFDELAQRNDLRLTDNDGDGIYEVSIQITAPMARFPDESGTARWHRDPTVELTGFPIHTSSFRLMDALYNMSLEELRQNVREDGSFMAGAEWPGVWTRDISYSILLSLALIDPQTSQQSLLAKVRRGKIVQDTGTGGAWPVSTDRLTWVLAAWEIYLVTGDTEWLKTAYDIIIETVEADLLCIHDPVTGLVFGESSFLDWREQTYAAWMEPVDIFESLCLGTNAVHQRAYQILAQMEPILGIADGPRYADVARRITQGMNQHLWCPHKGYYGQFLYGRQFKTLSERFETLGESLAILFGIATPQQRQSIIRNSPGLQFGIPCIHPQIPGIPPYHNDGIWPFVQAFWTWAAAETGDIGAVEYGLSTLIRASGLFLTNKENMVASTGDFSGTEINSDRQLWSVSGMLAAVYRIIFGIRLTPDALVLEPCVPFSYSGSRTIRGLRYRNADLVITIQGYGTEIQSVALDGNAIDSAIVPATLSGRHELVIILDCPESPSSLPFDISGNQFSLSTPIVANRDELLEWPPVANATEYRIIRNGSFHVATTDTLYQVSGDDLPGEFQVYAVQNGVKASFMSTPLWLTGEQDILLVEPGCSPDQSETHYRGYTGNGYASLKGSGDQVKFEFILPRGGAYALDWRYANGSGPIHTDSKCAVRTLLLDGFPLGVIVMPQRGTGQWDSWGYSNRFPLDLSAGSHTLVIVYRPENENMDGAVNVANIDHLRITPLDKE